ncbi:ferritin-like fold-containing protein [Salinibacterium sp. G-O1]|uniref:ferritin-like fold-containing protein n=1 Tax=Salinibacterium sp. G-O1 TaxID=3046208 RepID=UPI0024B8A4C3|nr:ferritin-like fold-containing protein [Salinibacterium sp. G-O1]MDJ0334509.1 ferritin-like fold-containing protein [Salinibacterium sp. G-O1]
MANWLSRFSRAPRKIDAPRLRARGLDQATTKVELVELTPDLMGFLGRAAYVQLMLFENLSRALSTAPSTVGKTAIGRAAELSLAKHRRLVDEIERSGKSPAEVMQPFTKAVDDFERDTRGADWFETVVACYLTAGFLDDFFARLARGLGDDNGRRIAGIFTSESGESLLAGLLTSAIDENPRLSARLAMWGRRLVGDTMLLARSALQYTEDHISDEARIEPVFTELIAAHTRRMDALGLTA